MLHKKKYGISRNNIAQWDKLYIWLHIRKNRTFDWIVALLVIILSYYRVKEHTETINGKYEYNNFSINLME